MVESRRLYCIPETVNKPNQRNGDDEMDFLQSCGDKTFGNDPHCGKMWSPIKT